MPVLLRKEKQGTKMDFVSKAQSDQDMEQLLQYYGARTEQANLEKTRKTLGRFGSVNEELVKMRDESR
jgi:cytochrome c553